MKFSLLSGLSILLPGSYAFPAWLMDRDLPEEEMRAVARLAAVIETGIKPRAGTPIAPGFDASQQYVSTSGAHAFVAPGPNDIRGPCPGLNAMANHNYLPHNGVATITQFVDACTTVFGMGLDLATFLAVYGAVFDGDLTSWSIGGPPPPGLLSSIGLLGTPEGITNSHNKYETDVSPTRGDLYEYGNDYKVVLPQFEDMYSQPLGPNGYDLSTLTPFRAKRWQQSLQNNPYFFNGPFSGVAVQPAAFTFIYRFMANKSAEYPEGYLDGDVLKSFFAITGSPGSFQWNEGHERIPDNWYKRAIGDEYTIPYYAIDVNNAGLQYPEFFAIGGNTGKPNSFTGVDLQALTKGVYDASTLAQGNNALCLAFEFSQQAAPDLLKGVFSNVAAAVSKLNGALGSVLAQLGCPQLEAIDASQFGNYPGAKGVY